MEYDTVWNLAKKEKGMEYTGLTDEQKKKLDSCETAEDVLALAQEEGADLTPEQLEMISGGFLDGVFDDGTDDTPLTERWKKARRDEEAARLARK